MKIEISIFSGNLFDKNSPNIRIQFFFFRYFAKYFADFWKYFEKLLFLIKKK